MCKIIANVAAKTYELEQVDNKTLSDDDQILYEIVTNDYIFTSVKI